MRSARRPNACRKAVWSAFFPEGGIRDGKASIVNGAPMKSGFALLSALSNAPILPCVILGSERLCNGKNWLPWRPACACGSPGAG